MDQAIDYQHHRLPPAYVGRGGEQCRPGEAWTCTIQCDPGTRYGIERTLNAPGVEICSVTSCHCEVISGPVNASPPLSVQDGMGVPLAAVLFGIDLLLRGRQ